MRTADTHPVSNTVLMSVSAITESLVMFTPYRLRGEEAATISMVALEP
jgi:hypothetical protein